MKLRSCFGLGEIVIIKGVGENISPRAQSLGNTEEIGKVIGILHQLGQMPTYQVKYRNSVTGEDVVVLTSGHDLVGDPDFNHEATIPENGYAHLEPEREE